MADDSANSSDMEVAFMANPEEMLQPWAHNPMFFEIMTTRVITFIFGVVGNVLVIIVMAGDKRARSATNTFLVSLAIGDLLMLCIYGPLETYTYLVIKWDQDGIICKTAKTAEMVSATSSVLNLLAVTIERFIVIVFPMRSRAICTTANTIKALVLVWLAAFILSVPVTLTTGTYQMTFKNNVTSITLNYCNETHYSRIFVIYQFFILFAAPSVVMTVCYSFVIRELWMSTQKMDMMTEGLSKEQVSLKSTKNLTFSPAHSRLTSQQQYNLPREKKKFYACINLFQNRSSLKVSSKYEANATRKQVIKMLIIVVFLFYICWGPRITMDIFQKFNLLAKNSVIYKLRIAFDMMTFFHACINPFIYSFMSKNFRYRFLNFFRMCRRKGRSEAPSNFQQTSQNTSCKGNCVESCTSRRHKKGYGSVTMSKETELESVECVSGHQCELLS